VVIPVPDHHTTQVSTTGGKGEKSLFIANNKEFSAAVVDHLAGLIIVRETHLN
jgi:hypothetical protein